MNTSVGQRARSLGIEPRYVRRLRWVRKAGAVRDAGATVHRNLRFVLTDPEPHNFTYELANQRELSAWIATVLGRAPEDVDRLIVEGLTDPLLRRRLRGATYGRWLWTKASPPFGKRLAWYAFARIVKPTLIIETGVHDGLGSLALLRALERNLEDGSGGRLISFDVDASAGWLVNFHPLWELRIEATSEGLAGVLAETRSVGMLIHDSLHTYENEHYEFELAAAHLAHPGVLISDNAHVTRALADTCMQFGLPYSEFRERPLGHFYPGGLLGVGLRPPPGCPTRPGPP